MDAALQDTYPCQNAVFALHQACARDSFGRRAEWLVNFLPQLSCALTAWSKLLFDGINDFCVLFMDFVQKVNK